MEKTKKSGAQIYGYIICIVAVITFLICTTSLVNAVLNMQDPLHSGFSFNSPSLASYDIYKMDVLKTFNSKDNESKVNLLPDEKTIKAMYEAAKADKIQSVYFDSKKSIIVSCILIIISIILFITHWRWLKNINQSLS